VNEIRHTPIVGEDYPRTWGQFEEWFASEDDCLRYLERLRWRDGFVCPRCGYTHEPYRANRARLICRSCRLQCTVTSGTIFDKTRTPLKVWLAAAWYITSQKSGVSALGLQRVLGLGSYQTAWTMLHRFRRAMVRPGRERLKGNVEIDQSYLAIRDRRESPPSAGRKGYTTKTLIVIAVEILEPKGFGRIRLQRIEEETAACVLPFVNEVVEPGSVIRTDGGSIYLSLSEDYQHERTVVKSVTPGSIPSAHGIPAQTLATRHTPRRGEACPAGLLSRRVRLSLQPTHVPFSRITLLPSARTGCDYRPRHVRRSGTKIQAHETLPFPQCEIVELNG
jgi:transposase-like protein